MRKLLIAALMASSFAVSMPASAAVVSLDQWYTFGFGGLGSSLQSGDGFVLGTNPAALEAPDPAWEFTLVNPGSITFVDGFNSGDQFSITNFGIEIGITSVPVVGGDCGSDITLCLASALHSQGTFNLAPGNYSISGTVVASLSSGAGFFIVNSQTAVPEPATWALMLLGFGAAGMSLRFRRRAALRTA